MTGSDDPAPPVRPGAGTLPAEAFRRIVDTTVHSFVVIRADGTVTYAGGSIVETMGWQPEELLGRNIAEFVRPDELELAIEAIDEITKVNRRAVGVPMVFGLRTPNDGTSWVQVGAFLLGLEDDDSVVLRLQVWDAQHHFDEFMASLLADQPIEDVLTALCRSIAALLDAEGAIVHHGFDGEVFQGATGYGVPPVPLDRGPWIDAARADRSSFHAIEDLPVDDRHLDDTAAISTRGLRSCWIAPVPLSQGLPPATLSVWRREAGGPLIGHRHALDRSVRYTQLALVRTAEHQRLRYLAGHDSLTGVANRAEFRDALAHALAIGERDIALAFCDLDQFKSVNDTYGHSAGDLVLVQVADRLRTRLRTGDELARIGGDEFTILLRNVPDAVAARHVAGRLLSAVAEPFDVEGRPISLGLSIGIALSKPGLTADALLARADGALYDVKHAGGNQASVAP